MAYRNDTKGARAIHLTNGTHVLVEPGAISSVDPRTILRMAPGFVECDDPASEVPEVPADLEEAVKSQDAPVDTQPADKPKQPAAKKAAAPRKKAAPKKTTAKKP